MSRPDLHILLRRAQFICQWTAAGQWGERSQIWYDTSFVSAENGDVLCPMGSYFCVICTRKRRRIVHSRGSSRIYKIWGSDCANLFWTCLIEECNANARLEWKFSPFVIQRQQFNSVSDDVIMVRQDCKRLWCCVMDWWKSDFLGLDNINIFAIRVSY